jgi:type I restriction enzyme, S subunit
MVKMRTTEVFAADLFNEGRWKVEIFTDDNSKNLVSRWPSVKISEIATESTSAIDPKEYVDENFYYIGLENVEPLTGDPVDVHKRSRSEIKSRSKIFSETYVLYGRLRPYLRKVFLAEKDISKGLCSTEFIVLNPAKEKIHPIVLRAILASEAMTKQLGRLQIGAALPRVSQRDFFRATIPLPPMHIQDEIVNHLEKLREERKKFKTLLAKNPSEIERLIAQQVFKL